MFIYPVDAVYLCSLYLCWPAAFTLCASLHGSPGDIVCGL